MNSSLTADVIIIGAGAVGGMLAYQLAKSGVKVLLLESGPRIDRGEAVQQFFKSVEKGPNAPYPSTAYAPHPMRSDDYYVQGGPDRFNGSYLRGVGGSTWHWTGFAVRFRPNDFNMRSHYGVGVDWPIGYGNLQDYYETIETEWGVGGFDGYEHGAPRRAGYGIPGIPMSYSDKKIAAALKNSGWTVGPFIHARNSVPFDQRPPCCGSASCVPICPIGAKYDGSVHVAKAEAAGARLMPETVVDKILVEKNQQIGGVSYRKSNGERGVAIGKIYILCAHAIESPKLLLLSAQEHAPAGVANRSDAVGRYLMGQVDLDTRGLAKEALYPYRGPTTTGGIMEFRDGDFRKDYAAIGTSFMNRGWRTGLGPMQSAERLVKAGHTGVALREALNDHAARELAINSSAETLPEHANRVVPDFTQLDASGTPRPKVYFKIDEYTKKGLEQVRQRHDFIVKALQCTEITTDEPSIASAIIAGTTRMGTNAADSVVDPYCRSHDHANLFIVGTGNFPTMPINAPTLTAVALGLRSLEQIIPDLQSGRFNLQGQVS
jgi:glucose dehydrogenase